MLGGLGAVKQRMADMSVHTQMLAREQLGSMNLEYFDLTLSKSSLALCQQQHVNERSNKTRARVLPLIVFACSHVRPVGVCRTRRHAQASKQTAHVHVRFGGVAHRACR